MKLRSSLSFALLPCSAIAQSSSSHLRKDDSVNGSVARVIGGHDIERDKYPYFVRLELEGETSLLCGGSLIHSEWVLTAAHCFRSPDIVVRVGFHSVLDQNVPVTAVSRYFPHPLHHDDVYYDFMLLRLTEPITTIKPVIINTNASNPQPDDLVTVIGMGTDTVGAYFPTTELQAAHVQIYSHEECARRYAIRDFAVAKGIMLCAGKDSGQVDSCSGDSGGPLLDASGKQLGVVSWGFSCANAVYPGVYGNVQAVFGWIKDIMCTNTLNDDDACYFINNGQKYSLASKRRRPKRPLLVRQRHSGKQDLEDESGHSIECADAPANIKFSIYGMREKVTCSWLSNNPSRRRRYCRASNILQLCPKYCNACHNYCLDDPLETFYATVEDGYAYKDCQWLASSTDATQRSNCKEQHKAWRICRAACKSCDTDGSLAHKKQHDLFDD